MMHPNKSLPDTICVYSRAARKYPSSVLRARPTACRAHALTHPERPAGARLYCSRAGGRLVSRAGEGFGVESHEKSNHNDNHQGSEDDDEYEEVDFDYAAEVVSETWQLFVEAGTEQRTAFGEFFADSVCELAPEVKAAVDRGNLRGQMVSGFVPTTSLVVDATANTATLGAVIKEQSDLMAEYGIDASQQFPSVAQAVLFTLDEFFEDGEFTDQVEDAWAAVLGVVDQILIDPTRNYFVDE
mmetsp:Transcript_25054/g.47664  ORF Transcript_25054/g.47664 Transcript_25054/m.47664 type:complete len:242 (-) Transcript_25054:133-858(-)